MTWPAMFGSGALIGTRRIIIKTVHAKIRRDHLLVRIGCCAAVAGTAMRRAAAPRFATSPIPPIATPALASAWFASRSQLAAHSDFTYEQYELLERSERGARDESRRGGKWSENNESGFGASPQKKN